MSQVNQLVAGMLTEHFSESGLDDWVLVAPDAGEAKDAGRYAKRLFIPLHAVVRMEEVEREGTPRMRAAPEGAGVIRAFPVPIVKPPGGPSR